MKKIFQCLGTVAYSTIVGYLLWLLFYWITPYIMSVGWLLFFLYIFLAGGLIELCKSLVANFQQRDDVMNKLVSKVKGMQ